MENTTLHLRGCFGIMPHHWTDLDPLCCAVNNGNAVESMGASSSYQHSESSPSYGSWTCPDCGVSNSSWTNFCPVCGFQGAISQYKNQIDLISLEGIIGLQHLELE
ncbi:hypothetical protein BS50DRAFT_187453 [Corynespora cassiicola Philippines]|uniref:RanBP2-type domain-containing protein n=1 Tax=Corynespora cassiicola Philippines TaxID=1448308 RepID=A0A2T2P718_CORCC|nr:hypothetical protein BS50DRAFT_187453 [Corynespora cassiicola Philippines]